MLLEYSVENPLNREPPAPELVKEFITPEKVAYDRNHGPLPHLDIERHLVRVDGAVKNILELNAKMLREEFEQHEVVSALQCAGNRRHTMRTELKEVNGIDWFEGAVMNGRWRGPLLKDILERAGVEIEGDAHVAFACFQTDVQDDRYYGGSIPLKRALDASKMAMLALELNGKPLNINHGFPVRLVIPGIAGARWVKWIDRITVQRLESSSFYQQRDYKILPPEVTTQEMAVAHWHLVPSIEGMPINSVICYPASGEVIERGEDGTILLGGYALPANDDGPVTRVEVSSDMGKTWNDAEITCEPTQWSWAIWKYVMPKEQVDKLDKSSKIWCRATDKGGNLQPEKCEWNWRGVAYNAYGEIKNFVIVANGGVDKEFSKLNLDAARDPVPEEDQASAVASA